ncbi:uncharacterized protein [Arachis hypogaea]|uniref:uncharacterized protein n=1 Tax=Arachis hypogaea TaxID=3818 RepID=UPI003B223549
MEIYVDDMVAKTSAQGSHCDDLQEIFKKIRAYNMRLNPEKCAFGVQGGKFFGFMLTSRGIEANPEKYEAVLKMNSPKTIKEVQQLAGRVAALSRKNTKTGVLCQQNTTIGRNHIPEDRTARPSTSHHSKKAKAILPKPHDSSKNRLVAVTNPDKTRVSCTSDKMAEYEALLARLKLAQDLQIPQLTVYCDSLLVVQQIKGDFQVRDWRTPFLEYIKAGIIPREEQSPQLFRRRASFYTVVGDNLYRRGFSQPLLRCISKHDAEIVMVETHERVCKNHIGDRALSAKILRTGYYWPTMKRDCIAKVKACDNCQKHATISTTPAEKLHTLEVESTNRVILQALKKKLDDVKGEWADLIPKVLWSYNTTIQSATGETPFKLVYGVEALIPVEIRMPTLKAELYDQSRNNDARSTDLDLINEEREIAAIKQQAMKQLIQK